LQEMRQESRETAADEIVVGRLSDAAGLAFYRSALQFRE